MPSIYPKNFKKVLSCKVTKIVSVTKKIIISIAIAIVIATIIALFAIILVALVIIINGKLTGCHREEGQEELTLSSLLPGPGEYD